MKKFFKENWFKICLLLVLGFAFYWYEWRPFEIRKNCAEKYNAISIQNFYEDFYKECLEQNGLQTIDYYSSSSNNFR